MSEGETGSAPLVIGVDIGGTKTAILAVDARGRVVARDRYPTRAERQPGAILDELAERVQVVRHDLDAEDVFGVGVGVAGQVDPATGAVAYAPNLGWRDVPVRARLDDALGMPVEVLNDVRAATFAEATFGVGRGEDDLVCLFVGTGIGGGVVSGGRLLRGCSGSAGEIGHITVALHGPTCGCGNRGCLEAFAGGRSITRRAAEAVGRGRDLDPVLYDLCEGEPSRATAEVVARAAERDGEEARAILDEAVEALVAGAASIVNAFNPCLLVMGGGVVAGVPRLVDRVRDRLPLRALDPALRRFRIELAELGGDAGGIGAAAWARHAFAGDAGADGG